MRPSHCALALVAFAACGGGGGFPDARPPDSPPPDGTFTLAWTVTDTMGNPLTCGPIGAKYVAVLLHGVLGGSSQVFDCSAGMGTSDPIPPGPYDMMFELDSASTQLATAPEQYGVMIQSNQNTKLTPLTFSLDATGGLALSLASNKAGGNCGTTANGGAGITSTTITLVHTAGGACEPITLNISAGATQPAGSYAINCATPVVGPCIESDQQLTASGVASDSYTIHVRGNVGAAACWSNDDKLQVPPLGRTLTSTLGLVYATGTTGCP